MHSLRQSTLKTQPCPSLENRGLAFGCARRDTRRGWEWLVLRSLLGILASLRGIHMPTRDGGPCLDSCSLRALTFGYLGNYYRGDKQKTCGNNAIYRDPFLVRIRGKPVPQRSERAREVRVRACATAPVGNQRSPNALSWAGHSAVSEAAVWRAGGGQPLGTAKDAAGAGSTRATEKSRLPEPPGLGANVAGWMYLRSSRHTQEQGGGRGHRVSQC